MSFVRAHQRIQLEKAYLIRDLRLAQEASENLKFMSSSTECFALIKRLYSSRRFFFLSRFSWQGLRRNEAKKSFSWKSSFLSSLNRWKGALTWKWLIFCRCLSLQSKDDEDDVLQPKRNHNCLKCRSIMENFQNCFYCELRLWAFLLALAKIVFCIVEDCDYDVDFTGGRDELPKPLFSVFSDYFACSSLGFFALFSRFAFSKSVTRM